MYRRAADDGAERRDERGAILVITAIAMTVMLALAAFTIDLGVWFHDKHHLQLQADAGALAGADEFLQHPASCPGEIKTEADKYSYPTRQETEPGRETDPVPKEPVGNRDGENSVTATTDIKCPGSGSYIDVTMTDVSPPSVFSGAVASVFGVSSVTPSRITAHARVNLLQVSSAGGHDVLPYAITEQEATECCGKRVVQIQVNSQGTSEPSQSLVCNGSLTKASTESGKLMKELQEKECPVTQVSKSKTTCEQTTPPSCLAEFNKVSEGEYDEGLVSRFENGIKKAGEGEKLNGGECAANKKAIAIDYGALYSGQPYQLPTLHTKDPRVVTIFVVPNTVEGKKTFEYQTTTAVRKIPIVGYAAFYMAGWDHDPCIEATNKEKKCPTSPESPPPPEKERSSYACDPAHPTAKTEHGAVWGFYVKRVTPGSSEVTGTKACEPKEGEAATAFCISQLTQ